jgi:TRAP-type uncharacterized transport system substrate-binding protein
MTTPPKRHPWLLGLAAGVIAVSVVWAIFLLGRAFPPRHVVMATGPEGSTYREWAERYRAAFAREGIRLELRPTSGDVENLKLLEDPKARVGAGFASGGLTTEAQSPDVVSLGTLSYEPLWIFCKGIQPNEAQELRGKRVSIGPEGGGTHALMTKLLDINGLTQSVRSSGFSPAEGRDALLRGEIDCACMLTGADSPVVQKLLTAESVNLMGFVRADAYVARFSYLRKVILPMGVGDLATNRPPRDTPLVASASSLLVREDLHPAIQFLFLEAAQNIHSGPGILRRPGEFPEDEPVDVPLSEEARTYYKSGGTFLQRHLPFWLWVFATRLLLVIVPLAGIVYPLARVIPAGIAAWINVRLNRLYRELRAIEAHESAGAPDEDIARDLARLERRVRETWVPSHQARVLYTLAQHVRLVRDRKMRSASPPP